MSDLIQLEDIDKKFPGVHALKRVGFDLRAGEVHALMGENGAGKSTLMKVMSGVYQPDGGVIRLSGQEVRLPNPASAQRLGIGMIHQELALMNDLTVAQNIFIGREPRRSFGRLDEAALKQQMVEIAKALSFRSRILIMDEPTAALNDREVGELFAIINRLRGEGVGIVYISHKMDEIKRIADRVTVMRDGAYVGTVEAEPTPISTIISMMVGRDLEGGSVDIPDLSAAPVALEVRGMTRGRAVKDVSFSVKAGEIFGFAGLMGAGRTEVARLIFGADRREAGEVFVHGRAVKIATPLDAVEAGIGYLSEDRKHLGLALGLDVRDNIALPNLGRFRRMLGVVDDGALAKTAREYIASLSIRTPSERQEARLLSGGNQQKIVLAKWLLRDCDILIFDEPTRGIDVGAKAEIYRLLQELAAAGKAIIVISSELPEVMRLSHRIGVMCEGRLTGILPGGEATTQEEIMHLATDRQGQMGGQAA
jgi:ribose transport system ATP-binding protein